MNSKINKYLIKVVQYFVLTEGAFILYLVGSSVVKFFNPDRWFLIAYSFVGLIGIATIVAGFGMGAKRSWAIILYWILIILFFTLLRIHIYLFRLPNIDILIALNIIAASFMLFSLWFQRKK